jgi:hypothetical protein
VAGGPPIVNRRTLALALGLVATALLATGSGVRAQAPSPPSTGTHPVDIAEMVAGPEPPPVWNEAAPGMGPPYGPAPIPTMLPANTRVEYGLFETIYESLFGDAYNPARWRPLSVGTFFTEGWLEPWAGGPAGQSGLTPRHGWLGSFEGVFYRLWLTEMTYLNNLNKPYGGNGYSGNYTIFLPFSRRFEMDISVPFDNSHGTTGPRHGYRSDFGDLAVTPRFLLSETEAFTQTLNLLVNVPTGNTQTGGHLMALFPRYSFWSNPGGPWVFRGGGGVDVPLNKDDFKSAAVVSPGGNVVPAKSTVQTTLGMNLAIGRYFRPHDVPFGDLVFYANANTVIPLEDRSQPTYVGVGPGTRFQIIGNWYFLNYWEFPLTGPRPFTYQMQAAIVKVF